MRFQRAVDELITLGEFAALIFVADLDVFQPEAGPMSAGCAYSAPAGLRRTIGVFDQIKEVVADPAHLFHGHRFALTEDAGLAGKADIKRLGAKVLAKLQVFEEAHPLSSPIIPRSPSFLS